MRRYPYTIENGAGEWLTFSKRIQEPDGERLVGDTRVAPGAGPPMHVHHLQDESFTVVRGRIGIQLDGEEPRFAEAGETILFKAGQPHRFWNAGPTELYCTAYIKPPGNVEYFLSSVFASQKNNGGRPDIFDVAYLTRRYRTEYSMSVIPAVVQRLLFPAIIAIGHALGKYRKYADAPEPERG